MDFFDPNELETLLKEVENHKPDYNTNAESYYKALAKHKYYMKLFTAKIIQLNNEMKQHFEEHKAFTQEKIDEFQQRLDGIKEEIKGFFNQWLADGVLDEVINQDILNQKADKTALEKTTKHMNFNALQVRRLTEDRLKNNLPSKMKVYELPERFNYKNLPITIYSDGNSFITDYKKENFKYSGGKTIHVSPVGIFENDGTSIELSTTIRKALSLAVPGDTIQLNEGVYEFKHFDFQTTLDIIKGVNIIGVGNVLIIYGAVPTFTRAETTNNLWQTTSSSCRTIVDKNFNQYGYGFEKVTTLSECDSKKGTFFIDGTTVYVHPLTTGDPTGKLANLMKTLNWFRVMNDGTQPPNMKVYFENLKVLGGDYNTFRFDHNTFTIAHEIEVYHNASEGFAFRSMGGSTLFYKCVGSINERDGFSYQNSTARGIEIDCVGSLNGLSNISTLNDGVVNGSTAHDGAKVITINGDYYGNSGGNIADVSEGTQRLCLGTRAFENSFKSGDYRDCDFTTQQFGAEMWLDSCDSWGSAFNILAVEGTTINVRNTTYDQLGGLGEIVEF